MKKIYSFVAALLVSATALGATFQYFNPAAGILKGNPSTYVTTAAVSSDILATFSGTCNSTTFMRGDGSCQTPPGAGGGTVNSVGLSAPSVFGVSGSPITNTGTLALSFATGQTANSFLATPDGTTGALSLRTIVLGDLPTITAAKGGTGVATLTGIAKGNGTSAFSVAGSSDVIATWSGTCSSSTFLRGDGSCQTPATGTGTVTSVALTVPSGFSVTGSPVTTSGTLAISGTLNPAAGGTGVATLTGIAKGNGTSAFSVAASGDITGMWGGTCSAATYLRGDGTCQTPPTGGTSANPSATIGLTAVNGAASTYLRSDGAPALSQAIAPTWTGQHIFGLTNGLGAWQVNATVPITSMWESGAATDTKMWRTVVSGGTLIMDAASDTASASNAWVSVARSTASISSVALLTGTNSTRLSINSTGNVTVNAPSSGIALTASGAANSFATRVVGSSTTGQSRGLIVSAGTNASDYGFNITNQANTIDYAYIRGDGSTIWGYNGSAATITTSAAGNVTVAAPSSGTPLTVAGASAGGAAVGATGGFIQSQGLQTTGGPASAATVFDGIYDGGTHSVGIATNGSARVLVASTGAVTINAPTSGNNTLTLNGAASGNPLTVNPGSGNAGIVVTTAGANPGLAIVAGGGGDEATLNLQAGSDTWKLGSDDSLNYAYFRNVNSGNDLITFDTSDRVAFPVVGTTASAANAFLDNSVGNRLLRSTSSRRYKKDIIPLGASLNDEVMKLKAVRYHSKAEADSKTDWFYGLIAEDVAAVEPRLVVYDKDGQPDGVQYDRVGVLLLGVVQEQQEQIKALREELNELKKKVH